MDVEYYLKKDYIGKLVSEGRRIDGRGFNEIRELSIEKAYIGDKADGSARVFLGDTEVVAGISMGLASPYPDRPNSGIMTTTAEMRPMADPKFELGPPRENAIELARVVDRGIRESGCIDVDKLFIEDEKVWMVFIDLHMIDNNGNLLDAAGIAAMAALLDARMPKLEDGTIIRGEWDGKLPITCTVVPQTTVKIGDKLMVDAILDEEKAMQARLTVSTTDTINAMQKGGVGSFTVDEVLSIVDDSIARAGDIRKKIEA